MQNKLDNLEATNDEMKESLSQKDKKLLELEKSFQEQKKTLTDTIADLKEKEDELLGRIHILYIF